MEINENDLDLLGDNLLLLHNIAVNYTNTGKFEEAELCFSKCIKLKPDYEDFYINRANIRNNMFHFQEAIEDCTKAIEINSNSAPAYNGRAIVKSRMQDFQGAIEDFTKAIEIDSSFAPAFINRAVAKNNSQNYLGAIEDCDKAIQLNPKDVNAHVNRAKAKLYINDFYGAIEDCNEAIKINPNHSQSHVNRAAAKIALGVDYEGTIEDCNEALKKCFYVAETYAAIGKIFNHLGVELEKVICCYRIAIELDPKNAEYLFRVANYYAEWEERKTLKDDFFNLLGKFCDDCKTYYVDKLAYEQREKIAAGFYGRAFTHLMPYMRTDLKDDIDDYTLYLFVGHEDFILSPLEQKAFFFSDARSFPDKTDCPLINPKNQAKRAVKISYQHVRIRCLCDCDRDGPNGIEKCYSVWDRLAKGHRGIAYRLKIEKNWLVNNAIYTNKVTYTDASIDIKCESPERVIEDGLFKKHNEYFGEREWRMIKFGEFNGEEGMSVSFDYEGQIGVKIEAIYLGMNTPEDVQQKVIDKARKENIQYFNMVLGENGTLKCIKTI